MRAYVFQEVRMTIGDDDGDEEKQKKNVINKKNMLFFSFSFIYRPSKLLSYRRL